MQQVNAYPIYLLGKWLDSSFLHARAPLRVNLGAWNAARYLLDSFLNVASPMTFNEAWVAANTLRGVIDAALRLQQADEGASLTEDQVSAFNSAYGAFEQALAIDLARAPVFFVTQKGIYSTPWLINSAELALAPDVFGAISEDARKDLNQSGRCLAFGTATASGYHAVRSVEKVLREYFELVTGKPAGNRTMGKMLTDLKGKPKTDVKTLAALDQFRDLHRNPISHPTVFLDGAEAQELFDISKSAISAIARQIMKLRPITNPSP